MTELPLSFESNCSKIRRILAEIHTTSKYPPLVKHPVGILNIVGQTGSTAENCKEERVTTFLTLANREQEGPLFMLK